MPRLVMPPGRVSARVGASEADNWRMDETNGVEPRTERAVFETDRHRVVGDVTLPPEGYQSRVSDLLNRDDLGFVPLVDVEIAPLGGGEVERHAFLALGKAHVRVAYLLAETE
jgi:uncharacterized protein DUF6812